MSSPVCTCLNSNSGVTHALALVVFARWAWRALRSSSAAARKLLLGESGVERAPPAVVLAEAEVARRRSAGRGSSREGPTRSGGVKCTLLERAVGSGATTGVAFTGERRNGAKREAAVVGARSRLPLGGSNDGVEALAE